MEDDKKPRGTHKIVTLDIPGRPKTHVLCLRQDDNPEGATPAYYVLAECDGKPLKWRSMIKDNAVRRLRDEFVQNIVREEDVDNLDMEMIFFCSTEPSNA